MEYSIRSDNIQNYTIQFHRGGNEVGRLDFNGEKMVFIGEAEESAKVFFDGLANWFDSRLKLEREIEREACAKVCEEEVDRVAEHCALAIRGRKE